VGLVKPVTQDFISDGEELYRNVRRDDEADEYFPDPTTGRVIITSQAFLDKPQNEPSVDRAKLKNFEPQKSLLKENNGVVSLIAGEVRQIGDVKSEEPKGSHIDHAVDVIHDPKPENDAHSKIVVEPNYFYSDKKGKAFRLLRKALARLATKRGWTLEPKGS